MTNKTKAANKATVKDGLPTAEEVLKKNGIWLADFISSSTHSATIHAMQEHTEQHTQALRGEINRLNKQVSVITKQRDFHNRHREAGHDAHSRISAEYQRLSEENAMLQERVKELEALMQEFVDRVDRGEVRSKRTYAKFKEALKK